MKHAVSRELFDYWNGLCDGRTSPERGDIDPAAIRHILAYTFVLEVSGAGRDREVTIRLSGTRLDALFRSELKGRAFHRIWSPGAVAAADALVETVLRDRIGVVAGVKGATACGDELELELLLLPLRHHGRTHVRMLGSLAATVVPTWIGLHALSGLDVTTARFLAATPAQPRPDRLAADGSVRHNPAMQIGGVADGRQVGSLRVYDGGRDAEPIAFRTATGRFIDTPEFSSP